MKLHIVPLALLVMVAGSRALEAQDQPAEQPVSAGAQKAGLPTFEDLRPIPQSARQMDAEAVADASRRARGILENKLQSALNHAAELERQENIVRRELKNQLARAQQQTELTARLESEQRDLKTLLEKEQAARLQAEKAQEATEVARLAATAERDKLKQQFSQQAQALKAANEARSAAEIAGRHQEKLRRKLEQQLARLAKAKPAPGAANTTAAAVKKSAPQDGGAPSAIATARNRALAEARRRARAARLRRQQQRRLATTAAKATTVAKPPASAAKTAPARVQN